MAFELALRLLATIPSLLFGIYRYWLIYGCGSKIRVLLELANLVAPVGTNYTYYERYVVL